MRGGKGGEGRMLRLEQKKLILEVLRKEQKRWFSKHRGKLLNQTIEDLAQMVRNEEVNADTRNYRL